jgi:hypothetical protein
MIHYLTLRLGNVAGVNSSNKTINMLHLNYIETFYLSLSNDRQALRATLKGRGNVLVCLVQCTKKNDLLHFLQRTQKKQLEKSAVIETIGRTRTIPDCPG